jgi:hypothetical protein
MLMNTAQESTWNVGQLLIEKLKEPVSSSLRVGGIAFLALAY